MKRPNVPVQGQGFVQPEISQNDILIRHKAESRIDSRLFAERIGIKHKSLYSLIQKHKTGLRELGILPFQTERLKTNQHGEREHKFALLNSDQFDYMRHIVSHFAAERMKHVKQYLEEVLSNYRAGGSVRREYLHDAGMAGKTKATTKGSPVEIKEIKRITNYAMSVAGGQGYQPGGRFLVAFNRRGYFSTKSSRANRFCGCFFTPGRGVNSSGSDISLARFSSSWRSSMRCKSCLRCSAKISVMDWYFLFMLLPCKAMRRSTSHHGADSDYSDSLALRRWRRLISPRMAVTINCAVLSPVSFTCSIASTTSCGARACNFCDLLLIWSLSISASLCDYWNPVYTKKTKISQPLTTNDSKSIEAAMRNHITHPQGRDSHNLNKFTWRFMQCLTDSIAIFTVTAATEHEARAQLPHAHLIFVARIRQEVTHA
ncbi:host cell division inhibitor Icd-like protein [Escherichia coli]|nr:host cell division inhibitor Icd-like protein [Escherichia coli]